MKVQYTFLIIANNNFFCLFTYCFFPWGGDNQMPYKISALTILQYINFINNKPIGRIKYALN